VPELHGEVDLPEQFGDPVAALGLRADPVDVQGLLHDVPDAPPGFSDDDGSW